MFWSEGSGCNNPEPLNEKYLNVKVVPKFEKKKNVWKCFSKTDNQIYIFVIFDIFGFPN